MTDKSEFEITSRIGKTHPRVELPLLIISPPRQGNFADPGPRRAQMHSKQNASSAPGPRLMSQLSEDQQFMGREQCRSINNASDLVCHLLQRHERYTHWEIKIDRAQQLMVCCRQARNRALSTKHCVIMAIMAPIVINLIHTSKRSFPNKNNLTYIKTYHTDHEIIHTQKPFPHRHRGIINTHHK